MMKIIAIAVILIFLLLIAVLGPTVFIEKFKIDAWKDDE
ncbi:MAG: hypothetical protein JWM46_625 [Candidatus Kaiserbacteria bacterium]|nr:hypothetical protein [Candidatus Kaiserbacteria bacterium]